MCDQTQSDPAEARKRSVDNLQRLYTVVVSLAVTERLRRLLAPWVDSGTRPGFGEGLMLLSLLITIVPFYHGANRHLDATYVTKERKATVGGALLVDFIFLFLEGLLLFGVAMITKSVPWFYTVLAGVFIFDALWVLITRFLTRGAVSGRRVDPHYTWAILNVAAAFALYFSVWENIFHGSSVWSGDNVRDLWLFAIVLLRTILDYFLEYSFYYPEYPE
jgi:hypothetical protein